MTAQKQNIIQLATFTINALGTLRGKFPDLISNHIKKLERQLAGCRAIQDHQQIAGWDLYRYRQREEALLKQFYPVIRLCFTTAENYGFETRYIYFKHNTPSGLIRNPQQLQQWVVSVLVIINESDQNHLNGYKVELEQLSKELEKLLAVQSHTRTDRSRSTRSKQQAFKDLKKTYQNLKLYLKAWFSEEGKSHRPFFNDLPLTRKRQKEVKPVLQLTSADQ